jgi:hypothetical protein
LLVTLFCGIQGFGPVIHPKRRDQISDPWNAGKRHFKNLLMSRI